MAIDHPEMIHKLVLAVTAPNANPVVQEALNCWIDMAERGDHTSLMIDTAERMYSAPYLQKNRRLFPLLARFTRPKDYKRFFINARAILGFDCRSTLQRISCPTLILAGSDDRTVGGEAAYELHRAIPDSELFVYEGLGHGVFEEAKDFYERVREFYMR